LLWGREDDVTAELGLGVPGGEGEFAGELYDMNVVPYFLFLRQTGKS